MMLTLSGNVSRVAAMSSSRFCLSRGEIRAAHPHRTWMQVSPTESHA